MPVPKPVPVPVHLTPEAAGLEPLLDAEGVARALNITPRSAANMLARRELPVVKLGRRVRVRPSDLAAYLAENTREARA